MVGKGTEATWLWQADTTWLDGTIAASLPACTCPQENAVPPFVAGCEMGSDLSNKI